MGARYVRLGRAAAVLAAAGFLLRAPALFAQCAMCNTAAASGNVGRGLSISVLFMLGILGGVVGCFVLVVVRSSRHKVAADEPPSSPSSSPRLPAP